MTPAPPDTMLMAYSMAVQDIMPAFVLFLLWGCGFAVLVWRFRHELPPWPRWRGW